MTFPPDRTMISLAALDNASAGKSTPDGRQFAEVRLTDDTLQLWEVAPDELDTLEAAGWVELLPPETDDPDDIAKIRVTKDGKYWVKRWVKLNRRRLPQLLRDHAGLLVEANT
jgi:hypothetical protein